MTLSRFVLLGRVVTMDDAAPAPTLLDAGALEVDDGRIAGVRPAAEPPPDGWEDVPRIPVDGTMYPGLIELHNHLSYDALPLWDVPERYADREQWGRGRVPEYRKLVTGPMAVLGKRENLLGPLARYVECKALLGGTTTSQGLGLAAAGGSVRRFFRGLVRNVEASEDPALPSAATRIADVPAAEAGAFLDRLGTRRLLLHLAEGIGTRARSHFLDLHLPDGRWALAPGLVGIHSAGLSPEDFRVLAGHGVGIVWSPLSNLLLYGATADIAAAREAGVAIALGGDWSPSGSKNLLGELKAARAAAPDGMSDREIVAMATSTAARLLGWDGLLGSLRAGARADLIVVDDDEPGGTTAPDPYRLLIGASEADLNLVVIDGVPRLGRPGLMAKLGVPEGEKLRIGRRERVLHLGGPDEDPLVAGLSLARARAELLDAMQHLPELAKQDEKSPKALADGGWQLELDHQPDDLEFPGASPSSGLPSGLAAGFVPAQVAPPLSTVLEPMRPDGLTARDDEHFRTTLAAERNLPEQFRDELLTLYGAGR